MIFYCKKYHLLKNIVFRKVFKEILPISSMDNIRLRQEYKTKKGRKDYNERYELWKAVERYTIEVGLENYGKLDV